MNAQGQLQSQAGLPVRSQGGPITIPPNTARIDVTKDGTILANDVEVGKLQLADFFRSSTQRVGTTLFEGLICRQPLILNRFGSSRDIGRDRMSKL